MKDKIVIVLLLCVVVMAAGAQTQVPSELAAGLEAFESGDLEEALEHFLETRSRDDISAWQGHALFWTGRTQLALGRFEAAADTFDLFLSRYEDHPYREESMYQRARLFYLQGEYEAAVQRFEEFADAYPESDFYPNALYWAGEALFSLGRLDDAERFFAEVVENYPTSYRVEAARYRLDVIELSRREDELLTLLQWSHEEYLSALESFQQRQRSYEEALQSYRNRLAGLASEDFQAEIAILNERIEELESMVDERDATIHELLAQLRQLRLSQSRESEPAAEDGDASGGAAATDSTDDARGSDDASRRSDLELRETLLSLKAQALELQELLLEEQEADR